MADAQPKKALIMEMTINKCQFPYLGEEIGKSQCRSIQFGRELHLRDYTFEKVPATSHSAHVAVPQE